MAMEVHVCRCCNVTKSLYTDQCRYFCSVQLFSTVRTVIFRQRIIFRGAECLDLMELVQKNDKFFPAKVCKTLISINSGWHSVRKSRKRVRHFQFEPNHAGRIICTNEMTNVNMHLFQQWTRMDRSRQKWLNANSVSERALDDHAYNRWVMYLSLRCRGQCTNIHTRTSKSIFVSCLRYLFSFVRTHVKL